MAMESLAEISVAKLAISTSHAMQIFNDFDYSNL
jgi:hypothetical protein